jgi:hypothetical protein
VSEPARAGAPASLEDRRADGKPRTHRWTRWRRELPKLYKLSAPALELAGELARRADNETGECHGYKAGFAAATGRSERTIHRATRELLRLELIAYTPGGQRPGKQSPHPCRYRLLPLEGGTPCPQEEDTQSSPGGHTVRERGTPCPQEEDTQSSLTVLGTTSLTSLPPPSPELLLLAATDAVDVQPVSQPEDGGGGEELSSADEAPRPAGRRTCDTEQWSTDLRRWIEAKQLPVEHLAVIANGIDLGLVTGDLARPSIVAYLEQRTSWRDTHSPPPVDSDQLSMFENGERFAS